VTTVKRWAFVPLLLIVLAMVGGIIAQNSGHGLTAGNVAGVVVAVPAAIVIARRRRSRGY
jgi:hypothetical protein